MCDGEAMWTDNQFTELEGLNGIGKFTAKSFGNTLSTHASCITDEGETYSQVIFYKEGFTYDVVKNDFDYNVTLVTEVDKAAYFTNYINAIR